MKIQRLDIYGFGRLQKATFDLAPGLNIFAGHNEAGKSTLQQAILALIYGFRKSRRAAAGDNEWIERYRPWQSAAYGGALEYSLDCGGAYKVVRVAESSHFTTTVLDADSGIDVSNAFALDHIGNLDLAPQHFGVPRDVFVHTYFVRHDDLGPLSDIAYEIADTIADSSGKGKRHRTAAQALETLRQALSRDIGSERVSGSPLANADERRQELLIEKTLVELEHRKSLEDLIVQRRLKRNLESWTRKRDELKYFLHINRVSALGFRIQEVEKLSENEKRLREELEHLKEVAEFPVTTREIVLQLTREQQMRLERLARLEGMAMPARAQVEEMQSEAAHLREQVRRLEPARFTPIEHEQAVRELEHTLPEAIRAHQKVDEELKILKQAIGVMETAQNAPTRRHVMRLTSPERVRDLRTRWEALKQKTADAEAEAWRAAEGWHAHKLSEDTYDDLMQKIADLSPEIIADLKHKQWAVENLEHQTSVPWHSRAMRVGLVVSLVLGFIGLVLMLFTLFNDMTDWMAEGLLLMFAALFVGIGTALLVFFVEHNRQSVANGYAQLRQRLSANGFASLAELEDAFWLCQRAQPAHDAWRIARAQIDAHQAEGRALRAELRTLFDLPEHGEITADQFALLESEAIESQKDVRELSHLDQQRSELEQELIARRDAMQKAVEQTRAILKSAGMVELNLLVDLRSFLVMCEQRRNLDKLEAQLKALEENLNAKLEATLAIEADLRAERMALVGIEEQLRLVLSRAGIEMGNTGEGITLYNQRYEQAERFIRIKAILQSLERERNALLRSQSFEYLKTQHNHLNENIRALLEHYPHLADLQNESSAETLEAELSELQQQISQAKQALVEVELRLQSNASHRRSLAEVVEEIERTQERIAQLTFEGRAVQVALDHLETAADDYQRNFLPRLNQTIARRLEAVTAGHYHAVQVDRADFGVRVEAPELRQFITPEYFSKGVQDQIYLLLRLGLAELISDGRETMPFLLDDPFVNYDHARLVLTLDQLARLAEQTQFLLFTKDGQIVQWFKDRQFNPELCRLHELR